MFDVCHRYYASSCHCIFSSKADEKLKKSLECYYNILAPEGDTNRSFILCLLIDGPPVLDHFVAECNIYGDNLLRVLCADQVSLFPLRRFCATRTV